jgi:hypothetical protein
MKLKIALALAAVLLITNLFAFDGKRKGFILGFGVGTSTLTYKQRVETNTGIFTSPEIKESPIVTDFKIGYAPDNSLELYYSSKVAWFSMINAYEDKVSVTDGVGTISASFFFLSDSNSNVWSASPFFSFGFGFSSWSTPELQDSPSWIGIGFFAGGGYEFAKHFRAELNFFMNNPSHSEGGIQASTDSSAIMLTINAMAF